MNMKAQNELTERSLELFKLFSVRGGMLTPEQADNEINNMLRTGFDAEATPKAIERDFLTYSRIGSTVTAKRAVRRGWLLTMMNAINHAGYSIHISNKIH